MVGCCSQPEARTTINYYLVVLIFVGGFNFAEGR